MRKVVDIEYSSQEGKIIWRRVFDDGTKENPWQQSQVEVGDIPLFRALNRYLRKVHIRKEVP